MIALQGRREPDSFVLTVTDRGAGLDPNDRSLLGQKFFRGKRHAQSTSGLGLGFWIANAFLAANQGTVEAVSDGVNNGMPSRFGCRCPMMLDFGKTTRIAQSN
jgi:two-component system, OmpR family, sensor histidine kinase KdpD